MQSVPIKGGLAASPDSRLRELMQEKMRNVPLTWLAAAASTTPPTIRRLLDGIPVRPDIMLRVFQALEVPPEQAEQWVNGQEELADRYLRAMETKLSQYVLSEETRRVWDDFRRRFRADLQRTEQTRIPATRRSPRRAA